MRAELVGYLLMSDGWTSVQHRPIINALATCPIGRYFLAAVDISGETKDAQFIADFVIGQLKALGPEKCTAVCMDGACKEAFELIERKYPPPILLYLSDTFS